MQIIEKEKFIKTKVYIATDGTEFINYDECQDYEAELKLQLIYFKGKKYIKDCIEF